MSNKKYVFAAYSTAAYYDGVSTDIIDLFDTKKDAVDAILADARATFSGNAEFDLTDEEIEEMVSEVKSVVEESGSYEYKDWDAVEDGRMDSDDLGYYLWGIKKKLCKG